MWFWKCFNSQQVCRWHFEHTGHASLLQAHWSLCCCVHWFIHCPVQNSVTAPHHHHLPNKQISPTRARMHVLQMLPRIPILIHMCFSICMFLVDLILSFAIHGLFNMAVDLDIWAMFVSLGVIHLLLSLKLWTWLVWCSILQHLVLFEFPEMVFTFCMQHTPKFNIWSHWVCKGYTLNFKVICIKIYKVAWFWISEFVFFLNFNFGTFDFLGISRNAVHSVMH